MELTVHLHNEKMVFSLKIFSQCNSALLIQQAAYDKPIQHMELPEYVPVL